jgi:hypothetical protein
LIYLDIFWRSSYLSYPSISVPKSYLVWMHGYEEHRHWKCSKSWSWRYLVCKAVSYVSGQSIATWLLTSLQKVALITSSGTVKFYLAAFLYSLCNVLYIINCMGIWVVWTRLGKLIYWPRAYSQAVLSIKISVFKSLNEIL